MVSRRILLVNEKGKQCWLEERENGSLWQDDEKIFSSETAASLRGWRVDALKILFKSTDRENKR